MFAALLREMNAMTSVRSMVLATALMTAAAVAANAQAPWPNSQPQGQTAWPSSPAQPQQAPQAPWPNSAPQAQPMAAPPMGGGGFGGPPMGGGFGGGPPPECMTQFSALRDEVQ